jgi:hypothetical protein
MQHKAATTLLASPAHQANFPEFLPLILSRKQGKANRKGEIWTLGF